MKKCVLSFSGGKDCMLAYFKARNEGFVISHLVVFVPKTDAKFHAHPIEMMKLQAKLLGLPILFLKVGEPFKQSYVDRLLELNEKHGVAMIITGDIDRVGDSPNWIDDCCKKTEGKVKSFHPLWQCDREKLLEEVLSSGIEVIFSCVKKPYDKKWLGRKINEETLKKLKEFSKEKKLDLCGEQGEYHTMVVYHPMFVEKKEIVVEFVSKELLNSLFYMNIKEMEVVCRD